MCDFADEIEELGVSKEEFKRIVKEAVAEVMSEAAEPFEIELDEVPDPVGLLKVSNFTYDIGEFLGVLDSALSWHDYALNTFSAYYVIATVIEDAVERGWLTSEDWDEIIDRLHERADLFAGDDDPVPLGVIGDDVRTWHVTGSLFLSNLLAVYRPSGNAVDVDRGDGIDDLDIAMKIARIRYLVMFLRNYKVISREWEWVGKIIKDLEVLFRIYKPLQASPGGSTPWSYGG